MTLAWPVAGLGLVVVGLLVAAAAVAHLGRSRTGDVHRVARTAELEQVPEIRRALRRSALLRVAAAAVLVVGLTSAAVLVARPVEQKVHSTTLGSRDIVLCLDVSGSMAPFDSKILESFVALTEDFSGERVALSIFDSTSRTVFPLTDDYPLVAEELRTGAEALSHDLTDLDFSDAEDLAAVDAYLTFVAGTYAIPDQASLVGDGLASCGLLFDEQESERSRSIILATDNAVWGEPIYTLPEAVELTTAREVGLYGLYGGEDELRGSPANDEFDEAVLDAATRVGHGGSWFAEDPAAIRAIVADVVAQQAEDLDADPIVVVTDRPFPWTLVLTGALVGLLALRWRSRT